MPPLDIADLDAGEGGLSQLLARRARLVIAVDNSQKMVDFGSDLARRNGTANIEYRLGDLEALPIDDASVDLAILRAGGRIAILDLRKHGLEEAREM